MISPQYVDGLELRIKELTERLEATENGHLGALAIANGWKNRALAAEAREQALAARLERLRVAYEESQREDDPFAGADGAVELRKLFDADPDTSLARQSFQARVEPWLLECFGKEDRAVESMSPLILEAGKRAYGGINDSTAESIARRLYRAIKSGDLYQIGLRFEEPDHEQGEQS